MKTVSIEKLFVPPLLDQQSTPVKKLRAPSFSDRAKFCVDGFEILGRTRKTFFSDRQHLPLADARARIENTYRDLCARGYRSLAVAYAKVPAKDVYTAADETGLVLAGFLSFSDPPLPTAQSTLRSEEHTPGLQSRFEI